MPTTLLAQSDMAMVLQLAVFPCLGIIGVLIGVLWRGTVKKLDSAMTQALCDARHRGLSDIIARFEKKLDKLCSNGVIAGLQAEQLRTSLRLDAVEQKAANTGG